MSKGIEKEEFKKGWKKSCSSSCRSIISCRSSGKLQEQWQMQELEH